MQKNCVSNNCIRRDNRGSAMITALVVGVVIAGFALSTLLVSYNLFAQTSRQTWQLQVKYGAQSLADSIEQELMDKDSPLVMDIRNKADAVSVNEVFSANYLINSEDPAMDKYRLTVNMTCTKKNANLCDVAASFRCVKNGEGGVDTQVYTVNRNYKKLSFN